MCTSRVCQAEGEGNYLVASRDILAGEVVANFFQQLKKILDVLFVHLLVKHLNGQVVMEEEPFVVGPNQETTPVIITIVSKNNLPVCTC